MTGVEGPVLATKQLYVSGDFQGSNMPVSARSRPPPRLLGQRYLEFDRRQLLR